MSKERKELIKKEIESMKDKVTNYYQRYSWVQSVILTQVPKELRTQMSKEIDFLIQEGRATEVYMNTLPQLQKIAETCDE